MKKILAMLLAVAMLLSLAACGPQGGETTPATKPNTEVKPTTPQQTEPKETEAKAYAGELPLVAPGEEKTLTIGIPLNAKVEDYETNEFTLWVEEQTGVNLKFQTFANKSAEWKQQIAAMVSANEKLPDIMWGMSFGRTLATEYGEDGYLLDISPYWDDCTYYWNQALDQAADRYGEAFVEDVEKTMLEKVVSPSTGSMYLFPTVQLTDGSDVVGQYITINKAWLDKIGKEIPTTVDEVYEVLKLFKSTDCNGNGQPDEIACIYAPSVYRSDLDQWVINAYVFMNELYHYNVTDGKVWVPYNTDEYREALKTLNKWHAEGLIAPMSYSISAQTEMIPYFTPADGVAVAGLVGANGVVCTEVGNMVLEEYVAMPVLEAETPLGGYANKCSPTYRASISISADTEDPELAVKMVDFLVSSESFVRMYLGEEGVHWEKPASGVLAAGGEPAFYQWVGDWANIYANQNNVVWHNGELGMVDFGLLKIACVEDGGWATMHAKLEASVANVYNTGKMPDEVIYELAYTDEESVIRSEECSKLASYISEARALFITGIMDPNDDASWQEYLDALKAEGLDVYLSTAQAAYDRKKNG